MWDKINKQSEILLNQCLEKKLTITTAESCTGGMIASSIVSISGSSTIFKSSVVTYSNDMKSKILNIPLKLINENIEFSNDYTENNLKNLGKLFHCLGEVNLMGGATIYIYIYIVFYFQKTHIQKTIVFKPLGAGALTWAIFFL